jgi:hypothetical protein
VQPQIREGVKIDLSQFASLVQIRGRFDKPTVGINAAQSAKTLAELGILGATGGGLAVLGRALIAPSTQAVPPCQVASSGKVARESSPASSHKSAPGVPNPSLPNDLGKALGKLLGR